MAKKSRTSAIQTVYERYEYFAEIYANKIFNFERYGYEKEDVIQEFRVKIYTSIISYSGKWKEFRETGRYKPTHIEYYIKTAMVNKVKDFIKLFNMEIVENVDKISIETDGFDYGEDVDIVSVMSLKDNICEINGVDLFQGLVGRKREIFSDYLSGHTIKELSEKYPMLDINNIINKQIDILKGHREKLLDYRRMEYSLVDNYED